MDLTPEQHQHIMGRLRSIAGSIEAMQTNFHKMTALIEYYRKTSEDLGNAIAALQEVCMDLHPQVAQKVANAIIPHLNKVLERKNPE